MRDDYIWLSIFKLFCDLFAIVSAITAVAVLIFGGSFGLQTINAVVVCVFALVTALALKAMSQLIEIAFSVFDKLAIPH